MKPDTYQVFTEEMVSMTDLEHPAITEARRTGYPSPEYLEFEKQQEEMEEDEDDINA